MRRKLWPKAPSLVGALGQMSKIFKLNIYSVIQRCYYICFLIFYCLLAKKKKIETEKWPKAADSPLHVFSIDNPKKILSLRLYRSTFNE